MRAVLAISIVLGACAFELPEPPADPGPGSDPGPDAGPVVVDPPPCVPGFLDLCDQDEATAAFVVSGTESINTDSDGRCRVFPQAGGRDVCLIYATQVTVESGGVLTATGQRPLAIASTSTMSIAGTIDVSSQRDPARAGAGADDGSCAFARSPQEDIGGAGGGAGGTFIANGGDGGTGDTDTSAGTPDRDADPGLHGAAVLLAGVTRLRGGCPGQRGGDESNDDNDGDGGSGGRSGGALYLFATQTIDLAGAIRATGAGGAGGEVQSGGGGGGSGGLVILQSAGTTITGQLSANGGGGGQGGGRLFPPATDIPGNPGTDGVLGTAGAAGGTSGDARFGFGGTGGAATTAAVTGSSGDLGGGGGGGAAGLIRILGPSTVTGSGTVSPPAQ